MSNRLVCGVDVGGTKLLAVAFDPADPTRPRVERRVPTPRTTLALLEAIERLVGEVQADAADELVGVGLGMAGLVRRDGSLSLGPNLPGIEDQPLGTLVSERVGVPVVVENDAAAATWGEHRLGAGVGVPELVLVTLGTGIGAGIVTSGQLMVGARGFSGEAGHMIVDPAGPPCPCGQRGCWERFASGTGLGRLARDAAEAGRLGTVVAAVGGDAEAVRGDDVTASALAGDPEALAVMDTFAWWVALGLVNLVNLLDPALIVVGGGLVAAGDLLLDRVRTELTGLLFAADRREVPAVVAAQLGPSAGAIGAGLLVVDRR